MTGAKNTMEMPNNLGKSSYVYIIFNEQYRKSNRKDFF